MDTKSGVANSIYFGTNKDNIIVYNRGAKLESLQEDPAKYVEHGRIERRLLSPKAIRLLFKQTDNLYLTDIPHITESIINEEIQPFSNVTLGHIEYPLTSSLPHSQARILGNIEATANLGGYNLVKKRHGKDKVFKQCSFSPLNDHHQPTHVLKENLTGMLQ